MSKNAFVVQYGKGTELLRDLAVFDSYKKATKFVDKTIIEWLKHHHEEKDLYFVSFGKEQSETAEPYVTFGGDYWYDVVEFDLE